MRKWFLLVILLFIGASAIIIAIDEKEANFVRILTFTRIYSRLITTNEETISIPAYFSTKESFLTDIESIDRMYLETEEYRLPVSVQEIRDAETSETHQEINYFLYYIDISFSELGENDFLYELNNCSLIIDYKNQEEISLEIGSLSLKFSSLQEDQYLSMFRMYVITDQDPLRPCIEGIVIGLEDLSGVGITIQKISNGVSDIAFDLEEAVRLEDAVDYQINPDDILGYDYPRENHTITASTLFISAQSLWYVPVCYLNEINPMERFPLYIEYAYQGVEHRYEIDDFQFYQMTQRMEVYDGYFRECIYYYT